MREDAHSVEGLDYSSDQGLIVQYGYQMRVSYQLLDFRERLAYAQNSFEPVKA